MGKVLGILSGLSDIAQDKGTYVEVSYGAQALSEY